MRRKNITKRTKLEDKESSTVHTRHLKIKRTGSKSVEPSNPFDP